MEIGTVQQVDIDQEMQVAYLDYAMSVIVARALPDARDGLKPVHRRILYAMHDMGLHHTSPYKKSARIVGEVLGKYHPHGDAAIYDSMVRMAQDFSMRYMLVDGQGNFGSIDGDSAAAMRYTEARQQALSEEMLADINKDTVDFGPNFDGSLQEPLVLPAAFPNLVVNGSSGIAVGMATSIPPHNLSEVCDAISYLIDHYDRVDDVGVDELTQFIKGPDFPTGGIVYTHGSGNGNRDHDETDSEDPLRSAYAVGRGRITVQAKAHIEEMSRNRHRIVVTELPYQVNKSRLIERIAELVRDGRIEGITDLRDESDRQGMRMTVELTRTVDPKEMLQQLFRLTPMRSTFSIILLALVDGEPRTLSLRRLLFHYVEHRREIITRRSQHDLNRARERAHILEGLLIALDNLDEVIQVIRRSRTVETAHSNLRKRFQLTDIQAQAILDMPLRRLAALEQRKLEAEFKEKLELISHLEDLLAHPAKILLLIQDDLAELKEKYGDARRTQIVRGSYHEMVTSAPPPDENNVIVFGRGGLVRREPDKRRYLLALGQGDKVPRHLVLANAGDTLICLTVDGRAFPVPAHSVPHIETNEKKSIRELTNVSREDEIAHVLSMPPQVTGEDSGPVSYLVTVTATGKIKRTRLADLRKALGRGETSVMNVDREDRLIWAALTAGEQEVILVSADAKAIRFNEEDIRPSGLGAGGVMAIKLDSKDHLVGAGLVKDALLLTVTQNGYGKVSALSTYPAQKRYGGGIVAAKVSAHTGPLVTAAVVDKDEQVILITAKGAGKRTKVEEFPKMGRASLGKLIIELPSREAVAGGVFLVGDVAESAEDKTKASAPAKEAATRKRRPVAETAAAPAGRKSTPKTTTSPKASAGTKRQATRKTATATKSTAQAKEPARTKKTAAKTEEELKLPEKPRTARKTTTKTGTKAKAQAVEQEELDLPVKRRTSRKATTSSKQTTPAKKSTSTKGRATAKDDELDLPVKRRTTHSQMPLPLEDGELDLPAPVKKPRRSRKSK